MMRITDPLWPAVREVSRRCLKSTSLEFIFPEKYSQKIHQLDLLIQQFLPARILQSLHRISTTTEWSILGAEGAEIANSEEASSLDFVYIPMNIDDFWSGFIQCCTELLQAGYPGCEDCIHDFKDKEWDENQHRYSIERIETN
jgi:hypothetical protein